MTNPRGKIVENLFSTMYYIEKKKLCFSISAAWYALASYLVCSSGSPKCRGWVRPEFMACLSAMRCNLRKHGKRFSTLPATRCSSMQAAGPTAGRDIAAGKQRLSSGCPA